MVERTRLGENSVLALFGEPGIGKTALLSDVEAAARAAGLDVLVGRAAEHEVDVPFGLVVDALDDRVSHLEPADLESLGTDRAAELAAILPSAARAGVVEAPPAGAAERFHYHRTLRALLELISRQQPVALLLDDLHWADEGSLEWVLHLLRRPPQAPVCLALALRPVGVAPRLRDALRSAAGAVSLDLGPLPDAAADELLSEVNDQHVRQRARREAGGNPLFLLELVRAAAAPGGPLPSTLVAAVEREVDGLPPASRTLLEGAAVAGEPFDIALAAAAAGVDADAEVALDQLVRSDLIRPEPDGRTFSFRHPIVRRAVYDAAPAGWRLNAHSRAAAALARRGATELVRAHHVARSANHGDEAAVAVLAAAATQSADTAPGVAADWYGAALALLPAAHHRRAELLAARALALGAAGRLEEAHGALTEAQRLVPAEQVDLRATLVCSLAEIEQILGRPHDARRRLEQALDELAGASPRARAVFEVWLALGAHTPPDLEALRLWSARARDTVLTSGDQLGALEAPLLAGSEALSAITHFWLAEPSGASDAVDRALAAWERATDVGVAEAASVAYLMTEAPAVIERFPEAVMTGRTALAAVRRVRQGHMIAPVANMMALALLETGPLDEATEAIMLADETARLQGVPFQIGWAQALAVTAAHLAADPAALRRARTEWEQVKGDIAGTLIKGVAEGSVAMTYIDEDPSGTRDRILAVAGPTFEGVDPTWRGFLGPALVRCLVASGDLDEAERRAHEAIAHAERFDLPLGLPRAHAALAEVELRRGDPVAAAARARESAMALAERGGRRDAIAALLVAGRAQAAAGDRDSAVATLRDAVGRAEEAGFAHLRGIAARELRTLGVRLAAPIAPHIDSDLDALTAREQDIAALVAEGRSNKEVGAALYIAPKTVEHNLGRIYVKLGIRSRTELAAILAQSRPLDPAS